MSIEDLRTIVAAGPPPRPTHETPGPLLQQFALAYEQSIDDGGKELGTLELVTLLAQCFDVLNYHTGLEQYESVKRMLEHAEKGAPQVMSPGGSRLVVP